MASHNIPCSTRICASIFLLTLLWPLAGNAASEKSVNDIIRSLAPIDGQVITKGYGGKNRRKERVGDSEVILDYDYSENLEIYFPFDSAKITKKARRQLDSLGRALTSSELEAYRYLIAGHTDAKGTRQYNLKLSSRRAMAVKNYLFLKFAIPPWRLKAIGWGEERLKSEKHPRAAINRRVQIIMIVSPRPSEKSTERENSHQRTGKASKKNTSGTPKATRPKNQPEIGPDGKLKIEW